MPPRRAEDLPSILAPIDERVALLEPMARAGRTDAMLALGRALLDCRLVDTLDDDAIRDHFIDLLLEHQQGMPDVIDDDRLETMTHDIVDRTIKLRDGCARLGEIGDDAWLEWIGRAAQAGDVWAIIDYVTLAVGAESIDGSALETSSEEIAERRARGDVYLQSALGRGDCMVLSLLAQAYVDGPTGPLATDFPADTGSAYAFLTAAHLRARQVAPQDDDADQQSTLEQVATALTPIERAQAQANGEAIYARCRAHP